jgi:hypothetical protein
MFQKFILLFFKRNIELKKIDTNNILFQKIRRDMSVSVKVEYQFFRIPKMK